MKYLQKTFRAFSEDECQTLAAALAYYTTLSLPPLLLIIVSVAGLVFGRAAVQGHLQQQIGSLIGAQAAHEVQVMLAGQSRHSSGGVLGLALGLAALLLGATTTFIQLQSSLNRIWNVKPDPRRSGVLIYLLNRVLSFGMVLGVGFLLLVSLALSAVLAAFGQKIAGYLPSVFSAPLLEALGMAVSFAVITVLFGAIFKVLPDTRLEWRDVWVGAVITSLLFSGGKYLIGLYLGTTGAASGYGAAGSLVLIVLWIYYSSIIVLLGAEFTKVWAEEHGHAIQPDRRAVRVVREERPAA